MPRQVENATWWNWCKHLGGLDVFERPPPYALRLVTSFRLRRSKVTLLARNRRILQVVLNDLYIPLKKSGTGILMSPMSFGRRNFDVRIVSCGKCFRAFAGFSSFHCSASFSFGLSSSRVTIFSMVTPLYIVGVRKCFLQLIVALLGLKQTLHACRDIRQHQKVREVFCVLCLTVSCSP